MFVKNFGTPCCNVVGEGEGYGLLQWQLAPLSLNDTAGNRLECGGTGGNVGFLSAVF